MQEASGLFDRRPFAYGTRGSVRKGCSSGWRELHMARISGNSTGNADCRGGLAHADKSIPRNSYKRNIQGHSGPCSQTIFERSTQLLWAGALWPIQSNGHLRNHLNAACRQECSGPSRQMAFWKSFEVLKSPQMLHAGRRALAQADEWFLEVV
eukprot:1162090-Pelagomonas_calceolata.AAC.11